MKRMIAVIISCILLIYSCTSIAYAAELSPDTGILSVMPVDFSYTDTITLTTGTDFPPGSATFLITISGKYDVNRDSVMSINQTVCIYHRGLNCVAHDVEIVASKNGAYVQWRLVGDLSFSWTSPFTGMTYDISFPQSTLFTFNAYDYV